MSDVKVLILKWDDLDERYVNVDGDTMTGNLVVQGYIRPTNVWHVYGGFEDKDATIECTKDTWAKVTNAGGDLWEANEVDGFSMTDDALTIANAGDYAGSVSLTLSGGNGDDFKFRVYNNTQGKQMSYHQGITTTGANNYLTISMPLYFEAIAADDELEMQVMNPTNDDDCVVRSSIYYISHLHDN